MTTYGFLIDQSRCIGCHACTVACKVENAVPLGVFRTWVKYVEKGTFPNARRYFQVTRCNHCANPPCVYICPTRAMYRRPDGIVEFDPERCIGCKACMQACPYDAIYIDPQTHTAAKCHFCSHRTDLGLEPACVTVCPTHAIIAGDLDDPESEISRRLAGRTVAVRRPEQGTRPKLFYADADEATLSPEASRRDQYIFAEWGPTAYTGPEFPETLTGPTSRTVYDVPHTRPWHWPVPAYLVTKAAGAGIYLLAAPGLALGLFRSEAFFGTAGGLLSAVLVAITALLLVADLDRPDRFIYVLLRAQRRSWLTLGGYILTAFGVWAVGWWVVRLLGLRTLADGLAWPGALLALAAAGYTALLFGQCEGRDLWQSPLLLPHLLAEAVLAGSGFLLLGAPVGLVGGPEAELLRLVFLASLMGHAVFVGLELFGPHPTAHARLAAERITRGPYGGLFWLGGVGIGLLLAGLLALLPSVPAWAGAALAVLVGLLAYNWGFVMAPQEIPNS
jgi:Fe-S-cluster-containing dehydrogenase component/formate-dependent nitrite reductase membrane component NrfD